MEVHFLVMYFSFFFSIIKQEMIISSYQDFISTLLRTFDNHQDFEKSSNRKRSDCHIIYTLSLYQSTHFYLFFHQNVILKNLYFPQFNLLILQVQLPFNQPPFNSYLTPSSLLYKINHSLFLPPLFSSLSFDLISSPFLLQSTYFIVFLMTSWISPLLSIPVNKQLLSQSHFHSHLLLQYLFVLIV